MDTIYKRNYIKNNMNTKHKKHVRTLKFNSFTLKLDGFHI